METIFLVIKDPTESQDFATFLMRIGYMVEQFSGSETCIDYLTRHTDKRPDLMLVDLEQSRLDGFELLRICQLGQLNIPCILLSTSDCLNMTMEAMRYGAWDFITKPISKERLQVSVNNLKNFLSLQHEVKKLEHGHNGDISFDDIIGMSPSIRNMFNVMHRASMGDIPVLIQGESGTGKELVARAIHNASERVNKPMVSINCGAIPDNLIESQLFGHRRGAFTGAENDFYGVFQQAHGGTLFLDEIGELKPDLQVKVLRALQEGEVTPIGSSNPVFVNVRIICATNRNLQSMVFANQFREDLFYRINVLRIDVPPLRERLEDVPSLVEVFIKRYCLREGVIVKRITKEALDFLKSFRWPGNVRQLENAIYRAVIMSEGDMIDKKDFNFMALDLFDGPLGDVLSNNEMVPLEVIEERYIQHVLRRCHGNMSEAARVLNVSRSTLYRKVEGMSHMNEYSLNS